MLDAFVYLTQSFETEFSRKMSLHFLEVFFHLFKGIDPKSLFEDEKKVAAKHYNEYFRSIFDAP